MNGIKTGITNLKKTICKPIEMILRIITVWGNSLNFRFPLAKRIAFGGVSFINFI